MFPLFAGIFVAIFSFVITEFYVSTRSSQKKLNDQLTATLFGSHLRARLERELNALIYLSTGLTSYLRVNHRNLNPQEIRAILKDIHSQTPMIRNLGVAVGTRLVFIEPVQGNENAIGLDYKTLPEQWPAIEQIIKSEKGALVGPVDLVQGGRALIYRYPVFIDGTYWGLLSTVIDTDVFLESSFRDLDEQKYEFAIRSKADSDQTTSIMYGDSSVFDSPHTTILSTRVPGGLWEYGIRPRATGAFDTALIVRYAGWLISIINGSLAFYYFFIRRKLKVSEIRYSLLAENISDVIWVLNLTKEKFTYISPSVYELRGYTPEEAMKQGIEESLTSESAEIVRNSVAEHLPAFLERRSRADDVTLTHELRQPCKDGSIVWIETATRYTLNAENEVEITGVTRNIEERKKSEQALIQSEQNLRKSLETRERMLSIIGHDLRGPVGNIVMFMEEILRDFDSNEPEQIKDILNILYNTSSSAYYLLENLLMWARAQGGKLTAKKSAVHLAEVSGRICEVMNHQADRKRILLKNQVPDGQISYCDEQMIETVIRNLVSNAIKFTPAGGEVTIELKTTESDAEISVLNTGSVIAKDQIKKLLSDETVTSSGTAGEKGSGLGIPLCRDLIRMHGSGLEIESNENSGTVFRFRLQRFADSGAENDRSG